MHLTTRGRVAIAALVVMITVGALVTYWIKDAQIGNPSPACTIAGASMTIDPEQASSAATITSVAMKRNLEERAAVIALATALQESKLYNLAYGDRDSVGLFQQRPSQGWGTVQNLQNPAYASGVFYDALLQVPNWRTEPLTKVAQTVQRSGYPDAYAQWEDVARPLADALWGNRAGGLSCNYDRPAKTATADRVFAQLSAQVPGVTRSGGAALNASSPQQGWRIASWLIANGDRLGIYGVTYAGRTWSYDKDEWDTGGTTGTGVQVRVALTAT